MKQKTRALAEADATELVANCDHLMHRILTVRGKSIMVDRDLAELYKVQTKRLNEQVRRNLDRFPERFMFRLTTDETKELVANCDRFATMKHSSSAMYAFTEQGVAMLATVLKSEVAVQTSIAIMDAFVAMRSFLLSSAGVLQRLGAIEIKQIKTDERLDTVFDALSRGNLLPNGIFPSESEFDAMRYVTRLVEAAQSSIVLIDPYSDAVTLEVLAKKRPGVSVRLVCKERGQPTPTEIAKFNRQYKDLVVDHSDKFHDRFLIIDNAELHNLGSSINSLGRRVTTYTTRDAKEIAKVLAQI